MGSPVGDLGLQAVQKQRCTCVRGVGKRGRVGACACLGVQVLTSKSCHVKPPDRETRAVDQETLAADRETLFAVDHKTLAADV